MTALENTSNDLLTSLILVLLNVKFQIWLNENLKVSLFSYKFLVTSVMLECFYSKCNLSTFTKSLACDQTLRCYCEKYFTQDFFE